MPAKKTSQKHIIENYRGNEEFVNRLFDLMDQVERMQIPLVTPFLTADLQVIAKQVIKKHHLFYLLGGYEGAELCRGVIAPSWWEEPIDPHIVCLKASYASQYHSLDHRDMLGALMNQGVNRDVFGDIIVEVGTIYLFCSDKIASYFIQNLKQVGRCKISFKECHETIVKQQQLLWHTVIISSLRLDTVVAGITHLSRQKAQGLIKDGMVKLNHVPLEETTSLCNNNDTVSIRGFGRYLLHDTKRVTQKGNVVVEIGKFC